MAFHTLTISSVDQFTAAGKVTVTIINGDRARFALKQGVIFQPGRSVPIQITELCLTEDTFSFTRPVDDVNAPWTITLCIETDQASVGLRSHKDIAGILVYLFGKSAEHHRDTHGPTAELTLYVQPSPTISPP